MIVKSLFDKSLAHRWWSRPTLKSVVTWAVMVLTLLALLWIALSRVSTQAQPASASSPSRSSVNRASQHSTVMVQFRPSRLGASSKPAIGRFQLEVAKTPEAFQRGLMFREQLATDGGMLFNFPAQEPVTMWMKNCRIPLDIVFIANHQVVKVLHQVPPCVKTPCPVYPSGSPVDQVVELSAGAAKAHNIDAGDIIEVSPLP